MGRYFVFFVAQKMNYFRSVVREMVPKVVTCTQSSNTSYSPHKINFEFVLNIFLLLKKRERIGVVSIGLDDAMSK